MTNANEPIKPHAWKKREDGVPELNCARDGLTKREYFAAMAMQGLLVNYVKHNHFGNHPHCPMVVENAVQQADDLINALNK